MSGGSVYELKWDRYRLIVVRICDGLRLWGFSWTGEDKSHAMQDLVAGERAPE